MATVSKLRVVIDTNVWVSGLVFGGVPERIIRSFIDGEIIVIVSEQSISELRRIVYRKFPLLKPQLPILELLIKEQAVNVKLGFTQVAISRDVDDNKFIETALVGMADYIISGDKDLLVLGEYRNIKIVKPADFLSLLAK